MFGNRGLGRLGRRKLPFASSIDTLALNPISFLVEPPKIFQELFHNANTTSNEVHLEVISGQAFYLHCHPYGNPQPEIYWFKDDLPLKFFDDAMVSTDFGEVIVAKKAIQEQSGNYTCVARNKVGNTSVVYLVDVLGKCCYNTFDGGRVT